MAIALVFAQAHPAGAADREAIAHLKLRIIQLEAQVNAEQEARDRQADAFDATVSRIEFANGALVAFIAIAGIGGGLLTIRWVRSFAADQVNAQLSSAIEERGDRIFEAKALALHDEYEERFSEQYVRFKRLTDRQ
ncbi:MAG TPA: hypothetical protein VHR18_13515 [Solirubrobacterales bacterium]|nr:hypothetical protein [Solirubrobacterales bacterium]